MAYPTPSAALTFWVKRRTPTAQAAEVRAALSATLAGVEKQLVASTRALDKRADSIRNLVEERADIGRAFTERWGTQPPVAYASPYVGTPTNVAAAIRGARMPWFQGGKDNQRQEHTRFAAHRFLEIEVALVSAIEALSADWQAQLPAKVQSPARAIDRLIPGVADTGRSLSRVVPGEGPLVIQVGEMAWSVDAALPVLSGSYSSSIGSQPVTATLPASTFPAIIDLVRDGGFATDHHQTVESAVARLLALLPAGQLKVHRHDPVKVGRSLNFMNDVQDATRVAIADSRVTPAELEPLIDELTRHVGVVTQQYLGSRHASLAEYNRAAGEVAEAYHLLVLMDFPAGRVDDDLRRKIQTLITAGPACGVFTIVHSTDPGHFGFGLPALRHGEWRPAAQAPAALASSLPEVPLGAPGAITIAELVSRDWRRFIRLGASVYWQGSDWSPSSDPEVRQLVTRLDRDVRGAAKRSVSPGATAKRLQALGSTGLDAVPDQPKTWWRKKVIDGAEAAIGVTGDRGVAMVVFESAGSEPGLLVGGQPGTGKSVLLHALICDLVRNYSPDELELYLLDPKQGVEFNVYAAGKLPHAKVITIKAPPESTILVLEDLIEQIVERAKLFNKARTPGGGSPDKLDTYLAIPGVPKIPRIIAVIDEFHALLTTGEDETSLKASALLDRAIREGRAFGIHLVLATQSMQGIPHLPPAINNMIESRVVLRVSEDDSRLFLGQHDLDASRLGKSSGKAILRRPDGKHEIQVTDETKDSVARTVKTVAALGRGASTPVVLDFTRRRPPRKLSARWADNAKIELLVARGLGVEESVRAVLPRTVDSNLLVVVGEGREPASAPNLAIFGTMVATCVVTKTPFDVVDFGDLQSGFDVELVRIAKKISGPGRRFGRGNMASLYLTEALQLAKRPGSGSSPGRIIFLVNAQSSDDLVNGGPLRDKLAELVEMGGRAGVHVVLHSDSGLEANRILNDGGLLRRFGRRVAGVLDADSSYQLFGSNVAERLLGDELIVAEAGAGARKAIAFAPLAAVQWEQIST